MDLCKNDAENPWAEYPGVGPKTLGKLIDLGIHRPESLLWIFPVKYENRTRLTSIARLSEGGEVMVAGQVFSCRQIGYGSRQMLLVDINDGTGMLTMKFFHFRSSQKRQFLPGQAVSAYGEVRFHRGQVEMIHPDYQFLDAMVFEEGRFLDQCLRPVYPKIKGIPQRRLAQWIGIALQSLSPVDLLDEDYLPPNLRLSLLASLKRLHAPPEDADINDLLNKKDPAYERLSFEELLAHQLGMIYMRRQRSEGKAPICRQKQSQNRNLEDVLSFSLTNAQRKVMAEIEMDLAQGRPMLRLVQGDVGSGKTIVALFAALKVVDAGFQVAVMAPTELLSEQHYRNFIKWLTPFGIRCGMLSGQQKAAEKREVYQKIGQGELDIVVGTHALFQEKTEFFRLGLVVIDEQHRFGVHQRLSLREKGAQKDGYPHQLIMTATPIPRTLAMTTYADLDCSIIDELPPGRMPIKTAVIPDRRRDEVINRIRHVAKSGRQIYWVCTLIDESEKLQCEAAQATCERLSHELRELRVGLIHGRMSTVEKNQAMIAFAEGSLDMLVATTVIEVGVDVPNASLIVIENAERLGLAQLHQLRGRVGRGDIASNCVLLYHPPLSTSARQRLDVMRQTNDGFRISEEDLRIRGPGEWLGVKQAGSIQLRVADLMRDSHWLPLLRKQAIRLWDEQPEKADAIIARWLPNAQRYAQV